MILAEFKKKLENMFPEGVGIDLDNYGQVVVYTGLYVLNMEHNVAKVLTDQDGNNVNICIKD